MFRHVRLVQTALFVLLLAGTAILLQFALGF